MSEKITVDQAIKSNYEISIKKYLDLSTKQIIIDNIIENCIEDVDGLKVVNPIKKYMAINLSIIQFYTNVELDGDLNELIESGTMDYIESNVPEAKFIEQLVNETIEARLSVYNSISGVLSRTLNKVVDKIPSGAEMQKIIKDIPKQLSKISPDTIEALKGIAKVN
jgi:hypothetical protein